MLRGLRAAIIGIFEFGVFVYKDENIGFDGYIGTWILRIYRRYIGGYFYMNIDISEIKLL